MAAGQSAESPKSSIVMGPGRVPGFLPGTGVMAQPFVRAHRPAVCIVGDNLVIVNLVRICFAAHPWQPGLTARRGEIALDLNYLRLGALSLCPNDRFKEIS
jgi:hypothetical protein